ncbi:MAG: hypothetical protein AAGM67_03355, partial [Bacteroidota bacterium]
VVGKRLQDEGSTIRIFCQGSLGGVSGSPAIVPSLQGGSVSLALVQGGMAYRNAGVNFGGVASASLILRANKPISGVSYNDGAGSDATYYVRPQDMAQVVGIPLASGNSSDGAASSLVLVSHYEGSAKVYQKDGTFVREISLQRLNDPICSDDQFFPAAGFLILNGSDALEGGYLESDVPVYCVLNSKDNDTVFANSMATEGQETALLGITPALIRTKTTRDAKGLLRIYDCSSNTWRLA